MYILLLRYPCSVHIIHAMNGVTCLDHVDSCNCHISLLAIPEKYVETGRSHIDILQLCGKYELTLTGLAFDAFNDGIWNKSYDFNIESYRKSYKTGFSIFSELFGQNYTVTWT